MKVLPTVWFQLYDTEKSKTMESVKASDLGLAGRVGWFDRAQRIIRTVRYLLSCGICVIIHLSLFDPWDKKILGPSLVAQFSSVAQSCPTLCNSMNCNTPGLPVHHQLPEFTQTHVHWVGDAIQPSHPLSSPSPPALNLSQHQGPFKWVSSSHHVAKALEFQLNRPLLAK